MRLGYDAHTDLAALALAESLDYHFSGRFDEVHFNAAVVCYEKAVKHLRVAIESMSQDTFEDATLITVALLAICEVMMSNHSAARQRNVFVHWSGLRSVFLAKYQPSRISDMGRSILYNLWDCSFGVACATGTASPFEDGTWTQLEPVISPSMTIDALALRKIASIFFMRVPTLLAHVRSLREMAGYIDRDTTLSTGKIASELILYRDDVAESAILHRVRIAKTKDESSRHVVPYSYTFFNVDDFNAVVLYWSMKQFLNNLCIALCGLIPEPLCPFKKDSIQAMKDENQRHATNLMMSWEFAETLGPFETLWVAKGLLQGWLELRRTEMFKNVPTVAVRAWALPKLNHQFNEWLSEDVKESDMDVAADLLVGGPLIGFIAQTGSQHQ